MSAGSTAVLVIGILLVLAGVAFITLDFLGHGDTSGLDVKDLGILGVGVILAAVGGALGSKGSKPSSPPSA